MFNIGPMELVAILAVALIVLGPNRLPEAVRTVGRVVGELRRISSGFQDELRNAFEDNDVIDQLETKNQPTGTPIKPTSSAIDSAAIGLSGAASTETPDGSEQEVDDDDLDDDGLSDDLDDYLAPDPGDDVADRDDDEDDGRDGQHGGPVVMDHLPPIQTQQYPEQHTDAGAPHGDEPPETDQRAAS
jgi:sec-independent protein translocase protein TatB